MSRFPEMTRRTTWITSSCSIPGEQKTKNVYHETTHSSAIFKIQEKSPHFSEHSPFRTRWPFFAARNLGPNSWIVHRSTLWIVTSGHRIGTWRRQNCHFSSFLVFVTSVPEIIKSLWDQRKDSQLEKLPSSWGSTVLWTCLTGSYRKTLIHVLIVVRRALLPEPRPVVLFFPELLVQ